MLFRNGSAAPNGVLTQRRWTLTVLQTVDCHMTFPMNDLVTTWEWQVLILGGNAGTSTRSRDPTTDWKMWVVRQVRLTSPTERSYLLASLDHLVKSSRDDLVTRSQSQLRGTFWKWGHHLEEAEIQKLKKKFKNLKKWRYVRATASTYVVEWWKLSWPGQCRFKLLTMWAYGVIENEALGEANIKNHPASGRGFIYLTREETR